MSKISAEEIDEHIANMVANGELRDSGRRRRGEIVWVATPKAAAAHKRAHERNERALQHEARSWPGMTNDEQGAFIDACLDHMFPFRPAEMTNAELDKMICAVAKNFGLEEVLSMLRRHNQ